MTYANDVITLLDRSGLEKVICLGTPLAGLVSMILAAMIPERIHAVILNDIDAVIDPAGLARIENYAGRQGPVKSWAEAAEQTRATNELALPDRNEDWWLSFAGNTFRENSDGIPVLDYDQKIGDAMRSSGGTPDPEAGWSLYNARQTIPTLLLRGELSDILSRDITAEMKARKGELIVAEIKGVGHAPML